MSAAFFVRKRYAQHFVAIGMTFGGDIEKMVLDKMYTHVHIKFILQLITSSIVHLSLSCLLHGDSGNTIWTPPPYIYIEQNVSFSFRPLLQARIVYRGGGGGGGGRGVVRGTFVVKRVKKKERDVKHDGQ